MRLTVVGNSGSYPGPTSPASCYLLSAEHEGRTWRVLIDLGSGALGTLHQHVDPLDIDAVLLSHLHADHCLDLCGFYVLRKYHPGGPRPRIPVWGPAGTAARMARAYDLAPTPGMTAEFDFRSWAPRDPGGGAVRIGPFRISPRAVVHPVDAYALRIEADGRVLVYSGDTAACPALTEHALDADVLLCEASFVDTATNPGGVHLTGSEAGTVAVDAHAKRLLLTHVPPWHDPEQVLAEARTTRPDDLDLARVGETYEI